MMKVRGIDFTTYACSNLQRSMAFYTDMIGLKLDSVYQDFYAEFDVDGQTFALISGIPGLKPGTGGQIGFNVPNLAEALAELKGKGVEPIGEVVETPVCRMAHFADPDGNVFVLHEKPRI
jgi:predicted enzyme related to lactoylglutathione lyase